MKGLYGLRGSSGHQFTLPGSLRLVGAQGVYIPLQGKYLSAFCLEEASVSQKVLAHFTVPVRGLPNILLSKYVK